MGQAYCANKSISPPGKLIHNLMIFIVTLSRFSLNLKQKIIQIPLKYYSNTYLLTPTC